MIDKITRQILLFVTVLALVCGTCALAQDAPAVRSGNAEIGGFVGASYGIDKTRVMGGGNVAYAATRHIMPYVEFSYFPGIGRSETIPVGTSGSVKFNYSVPLADFHGGLHIRLPYREHRVVPYLVIGAGMVHSYKHTENARITDALGSFTVPISAPARSDFAVNGGGGLRFYINEWFGTRIEAKAYRPSGTFSDVFGKVEFGFFFQVK